MAKEKTIWVIGGFIAGIASLCAALVVLHGWAPLAPRQAYASPAEQQIQEKVLTLLDRLLTLTEENLYEPTCDAAESALASDLQTFRSQLELYKVQHNDNYPGLKSDGSFDGDLFVRQMVSKTNTAGQVMPADGNSEDYPYGPYLCDIPKNPFVQGWTSHQVTGGPADCPGDGKSGWYFKTINGGERFYANDPQHKGM